MDLRRFYREVTRKPRAGQPHYEESRRDYQDALNRSVDGMLTVR